MSDEKEFELCEPFDIDHGELDGLRLQDAFTLGVEWQMTHTWIDSGRAFQRLIHAANVNRIRAMCERRGRDFDIIELDFDWSQLIVHAM